MKIVCECEFSPEELHTVRTLAAALGITEITAGILYARGLKDEAQMRCFLHPSEKFFLSPFLMKGMREAADLIRRARDEDWRVAVFGDYDADGIGACAILSRALKVYGIEPYLYIPEREDGYGLGIEAIDRIFDEFLPDLIITVDCGISCAEEVEYIKQQGAYVIVTDHHELPETLPDCICVNPKLKDDYPYDNLCGAGVAFKLATALIGDRANDYLDFCALSTVADSVPLTGENRDIVYAGLERIKSAPRPAFSALLGKQNEITAQTLAYTLAPRVNAAGRMGDARAALRLFTTEDEGEIFDLAAKLNAYNLERQRLCDELYERARAEIARGGAYGNAVVLCLDDCHAGLIGIVAARIAEEYGRPTILFVRKGDILRGSARSIECVNIFEALKGVSEYLEEFGGHAQAAGVGIREENFGALKQALDEYIGAHYTREDFLPTVCICGEMEEIPRRVALELEMLEPYGVGNRRPLFLMRAGRLDARPIKPGSPHLAIPGGTIDFMYFGGAGEERLLRSDVGKELIFECNLSRFRGKESLKGILRTVVYHGEGADISLEAFENYLWSLRGKRREMTRLSDGELDRLIAEKDAACAYGLLVVAQNSAMLSRFPAARELPLEVFRLSSGNVRNAVLVAPDPDCDLGAYREIVYLEAPDGIVQNTGDARLYAGERSFCPLKREDVDRSAMVEVFTALRGAEGMETGERPAETARKLGCLGFGRERFLFALVVFTELGLVDCSEGRLRIVRGKRTELTNSSVYSAALGLLSAR